MNEIKDTEIRILGSSHEGKAESQALRLREKKIKSRGLLWLMVGLLVIVAIIVGVVIFMLSHRQPAKPTEPIVSVFEPVEPVDIPNPLRSWVEQGLQKTGKDCLLKDTVVNDIPLTLKMPIGCEVRLETGYKCLKDTSKMVLLCQAADVRADNKKIVGAFVKKGKPLSWGLSKRGFCSIINDTITVGVAENTPLFEKATETGGYFFRQYPLVSNGTIVENELKTKSTRRGLCELEGAIVVVETATRESLHDFSQALIDIGVSNAIYLVGGASIAYYRNGEGNSCVSGNWQPQMFDNISFIIWQ